MNSFVADKPTFFSHFRLLLFDIVKIFLRALVSKSSVNCLKNGPLWFQWLKVWTLEQLFQCIKMQKGTDCLQGFHNLHHTMFQCMACLESYEVCVFENMQTIFSSIIWSVNEIDATTHHEIWLGIFFLLLVWCSTWEHHRLLAISIRIDTKAKLNFATHSDLPAGMEDQNNRLKVPKDISALIGYMIDTFRNNTPDGYQKVHRKNRNETRTYHSLWYSKCWSVNQVFWNSPFCGPMLEDFQIKQRQKIEQV